LLKNIIKGFESKGSNNVVFTSLAIYDHITSTLLHPNFPISDPLVKSKRKTSRNPQEKDEERSFPDQNLQEEGEYVLDSAPPPLTLAQKLGLVASPAPGLTEGEWRQVKARSIQQGESGQPCAICREEFLLQPQVLLSCSHVFHKTCLQAFERFSRRKCCPMCRKEQYETRVIHDAAQLFRHKCATRIQAYWRGYATRKRFAILRKYSSPQDKHQRRKFFEEKVSLECDFVRYCHTDTEAFLRDINHSLSSSRRVFQQLERKCVSEPQESDWQRIQSQVSEVNGNILGVERVPPRGRRLVLLSCSHLFHQPCLEAFEAFSIQTRPPCPLCRSAYHKKRI
uniref:Ring finger protein 32 n=1 Tax=Takifugu rubripes TaxID=31033 RepID=H2TPT8_TAKRU